MIGRLEPDVTLEQARAQVALSLILLTNATLLVVAAPVSLLVIAIVASQWSASRAARVDPMIGLRAE